MMCYLNSKKTFGLFIFIYLCYLIGIAKFCYEALETTNEMTG
jgi:hypothetical protein